MKEEKNNLILVKKDNQINYISVLTVISAIAVVILHTNEFWVYSEEKYWAIANIIECVFYFAVPIFFMISGITLIDYRDRYDTKEFLKRRMKKTLIPFICWSIIGMVYFTFLKKGFSIFELNKIQFLNAIAESKGICSKIKNTSYLYIINKIKKYTFSIYLTHWYVIDLITNFFKLDVHTIVYRLGMPIIVIPICILITFIIRKIPILKYIVPQ